MFGEEHYNCPQRHRRCKRHRNTSPVISLQGGNLLEKERMDDVMTFATERAKQVEFKNIMSDFLSFIGKILGVYCGDVFNDRFPFKDDNVDGTIVQSNPPL